MTEIEQRDVSRKLRILNHAKDSGNVSQTYWNQSRPAVLALLNQELVWSDLPYLAFDKACDGHGAEVYVFALESEQLALAHRCAKSRL